MVPSAKAGPFCHSIPGMQCSQNNGSSFYRPFRGYNLTSYLFLWRECKTVSRYRDRLTLCVLLHTSVVYIFKGNENKMFLK